MLHLLTRAVLVLCSGLSLLPAQAVEGFTALEGGMQVRVERDRGGADVGISLLWVPGSIGDPVEASGSAALFGRWLGGRFARWERDGGRAPCCRVEVFAEGVAVGFRGSAADAAAWLIALGGWLRDPELGRDEWELTRAAARLAADDVTANFPGTVVRQRAREGLLGAPVGRSPAGSVDALGSWSRREFEASVRARGGPRYAALVGGRLAQGWTEARGRDLLGALPAPAEATAPPAVAVADSDASRIVVHPFVESVYGVVPVPVPDPRSEGYLAFCVAAEWLRLRAWTHFEGAAPAASAGRLPLVAFDPELAPRLLFVGHRGLPGRDVAAWRASIDRFLDSIGSPDAADWLDARRALRGRLWPVVPTRPDGGGGAAQAVRARALVLAAHWGWPLVDGLDALTDEKLDTALAELLAARSEAWLLVPPPSPQGARRATPEAGASSGS